MKQTLTEKKAAIRAQPPTKQPPSPAATAGLLALTAMPGFRCTLVGGAILLALFALCGRLFWLQVLHHDDYQERSMKQNRSVEIVPAERGTIMTRDGIILAETIPAYDLVISPRDAGAKLGHLLALVAPIIGKEVTVLEAELAPHMDTFYRRIARGLDQSQVARVRQLVDKRGRLPHGLMLEEGTGRAHPQGRLAAALGGFVNDEGVGGGGVELSFDSILRGKDGRRQVVVDARRVRRSQGEGEWITRPERGDDIYLTISLPVQFAAEVALDRIVTEFQPEGAIAVVVDVSNGDILAMASRPDFDPNDYARSDPATWRQRAITDVFEPGSTFKTFILAAALDAGKTTMSAKHNCAGPWTVFGRTLRDVHPHGWLTVEDILVESSNVGASRVALTMAAGDDTTPAKRMIHAYLTQGFGFGQKTGIGLIGEQSGLVRSPEKWDNKTLTSVPMGYEVMVTPLQLASGYATIAAGGIRRKLQLIHRVTDATSAAASARAEEAGEPSQDEGILVLDMSDPERDVRLALAEVVRRGTAKGIAKLSRFEMGGKTGTTHKVNPETRRYEDKYISSFVGIAPIDDPRYVCLIVVDDPKGKHYGGTVAAPGVRDILEATLSIMPSR